MSIKDICDTYYESIVLMGTDMHNAEKLYEDTVIDEKDALDILESIAERMGEMAMRMKTDIWRLEFEQKESARRRKAKC